MGPIVRIVVVLLSVLVASVAPAADYPTPTEADFMIRANAPAACGRADAAVACLTAVPPVQTDTSEAERLTR